ncbi:MAG TPA: hypothetical protein VHK88_18640 [Aquihabitans sp.]|nr:hypothetical protein [Aquihabitans sp.]
MLDADEGQQLTDVGRGADDPHGAVVCPVAASQRSKDSEARAVDDADVAEVEAQVVAW